MIDHYVVLGIGRDSTPDVIKAAYRSLALQCHPDVNNSPDAESRMAAINVAYEVLGNPELRQEYDIALEYERPPHSARQSQVPLERIPCERCGVTDETLSIVWFSSVISLLVITWRREVGGILCDKCRTWRSLGYTLRVLLLGWWGLPWGPIYSVPAVLVNALGGTRPRVPNAELSAELAGHFAHLGDFPRAMACARRSNRWAATEFSADLITAVMIAGGAAALTPPRRTIWRYPALFTIPLLVGISLLALGAYTQVTASDRAEHKQLTELSSSIETMKTEVDEMETEAEALAAEVGTAKAEVADAEGRVRHARASQDDASVRAAESAYNELVDGYNTKLAAYKAKYDEYDALVDEVNAKVRLHNSMLPRNRGGVSADPAR